MESSALVFAQVMTTIVASVGAFTVIAVAARVVLTRAAVRRKLMAAARGGDGADDGRLRRIEDAVESIALEVERISEAQRFTVKLFVERLPSTQAPGGDVVPPAPGARSGTPAKRSTSDNA